MNKKEELIRLWFNMWLKKQDLGIQEVFEEDVLYIESYGPMYENIANLEQWFNDWNKKILS